MQIAVDGYNFIKQSPELRRLEQIELQRAREGLLQMLARYKFLKGHAITVVFDGGPERALRRERIRGIEVIFSKPGETADDVLKRLAMEKRGLTVVTSDREVADFAEKKGAAVISSLQFARKVETARLYAGKGQEGEEPDRPLAPLKKGPSRRPPKARRISAGSLKKL